MLMKTIPLKFKILLLGTLLAAPCLMESADPSIEPAMFKDTTVMFVQGGKTITATNEFKMGKDITVFTNGTFSVLTGKPRRFREGDTLGTDGMLMGSDGSIVPVADHIIMKNGKPTLVLNGEPTVLASVYRLGDGTSILPDATL